MDNFKKASQIGLRIATPKGLLSVEQLWQLNLEELNAVAVNLHDEYEASGKKSFLVKKSVKDATTKLKFEITYDILETKMAEAEAALEAKENKEFNEKILDIIQEKEGESLRGKSIAELKRMIKK